jgi:hypothetical protein
MLKRLSVIVLALSLALAFSAPMASAKTKKSTTKTTASEKQEKMDLNTASESDLDALPGIGPALAKKIIENRPYTSFADVKKRSGVPASELDKIRPKVKVSRSSGAKNTADNSAESSESSSNSAATESNSGTENATALPQSDQPNNGMVWVNLDTKVFHRPGDRWYGKTKHGKYMTEADAVKAGYRPAKVGDKDKDKE